MNKFTKASLKALIRKNFDNLLIKGKTSFSGSDDMCMEIEGAAFKKVQKTEDHISNTLGILGLWLVGGSRDSFYDVSTETHFKIEIYNCCGSTELAIPHDLKK